MFLEYGVNTDGGLVWIGEVMRGATELCCPYCGGFLTARKGSIKGHHFAHTGPTCRQTERDQDAIALPAYDNFNLHLPPKILAALQEYSPGYASYDSRLEQHGLIENNKFARNGRGVYQLTKKGKLVLGKLSLKLFNEFQSPLIADRHAELEAQVAAVYGHRDREARLTTVQTRINELTEVGANKLGSPLLHEYLNARTEKYRLEAELKATGTIDLQTALSDLRLFRAQWRRILACSLYFVEVNDGQLYKIGVTTRAIEQRTAEIAADLLPHLGNVSIRVLGAWPHRGNVELYFKHRYQANQKPIGNLTEYYTFVEIKEVIGDLQRMGKDRELSDLEAEVLRGELSAVEAQIRAGAIEQKRRLAIRAGMKRSAARGKPIGRPAVQETIAEFLAKPNIQVVVGALADGASIRDAAKRAGVSTATVQKVKAVLTAQIDVPGSD